MSVELGGLPLPDSVEIVVHAASAEKSLRNVPHGQFPQGARPRVRLGRAGGPGA